MPEAGTAGADADEPVILLDPGREGRQTRLPIGQGVTNGPLISCIMPTRGRMIPARHAIACFLGQSYARRELMVTCATSDSEVERHVHALADPRVRFVDSGGARSVGGLRNAAITAAAGELVCLWDDDDLCVPGRLALQYAALRAAGAKGSLLVRETLWWPQRKRAALSSWRVWENSMLADRSALPRFGDQPGEDTTVARGLRAAARMVLIDRPDAYCYIAHGSNLWGERHFDMLFANSSERRDADTVAYAAAMAALGATMPLAAYADDLAGITSAG